MNYVYLLQYFYYKRKCDLPNQSNLHNEIKCTKYNVETDINAHRSLIKSLLCIILTLQSTFLVRKGLLSHLSIYKGLLWKRVRESNWWG
jgi:hypothetical protein